MSLCLEYVGGPGAVEIKMQGVVLMPSWAACTCCLPPLQVNGQFVRMVKRGALQFVFLKPILAVLTLVLYATGNYTEGNWSPAGSYLWITIIYNITYTLALYALLLFYMGTHELLEPFRPLLKFILVKSVIFLTFWQGLFISICVGAGLIPSAEDGNNVQNFLICVEMLPAAIFMLFAFPWKEFASESAGLGRTAVGHAMSLGDVVSDTVHQFAPTYQNYVLYSDGTTKAKAGVPPSGDNELLYDMEMVPAESWDDEVPGHNGQGSRSVISRYLKKDDEEEEGGNNRTLSKPRNEAEARWQNIQLSPSASM